MVSVEDGSGFCVSVELVGGVHVVRPAGELDTATAPRFEAVLGMIHGPIVVDCSDLTFLDGDLWVLGPHGPIPVDPWGPRVVRRAAAARAKVLSGLETLEELGNEVFAERKKEALEVEVAPDEGSEEAEEMEREARKRVGRSAKRKKG